MLKDRKMFNKNTFIIYDGPSMLDGKDIVVLISGLKTRSKNDKTGDMFQTWILVRDIHPVEAAKMGLDASICGGCPRRPIHENTCYVQLGKAVTSMWRAYKYDRYEKMAPTQVADMIRNHKRTRKLRIGSYGDPLAVPSEVFKPLVNAAESFTGYTHQVKRANKKWSRYVMASADTKQQALDYQAAGFRTFRVRAEKSTLLPNEIACPASKEAGRVSSCAKCSLCMGTTSNSKKSVAIIEH
tara:strand:+ start:104 stop:826 length:723 start_codon:yes stop_codon:yes gene_type:complete